MSKIISYSLLIILLGFMMVSGVWGLSIASNLKKEILSKELVTRHRFLRAALGIWFSLLLVTISTVILMLLIETMRAESVLGFDTIGTMAACVIIFPVVATVLILGKYVVRIIKLGSGEKHG